jgi:hypothetical protein
MLRALKRSIEISQNRLTPVDELSEMKKMGDLSAEVEIGEFQHAGMLATMGQPVSPSMACSGEGEAVDLKEACSTSN